MQHDGVTGSGHYNSVYSESLSQLTNVKCSFVTTP